MDPTRSGPVALAERRLAWLEERQRVLAQNIANADTPAFQPRDLIPFRRVLAGASSMVLANTSQQHMQPRISAPHAVTDRTATERSPNGNAVALDQQAMRVADTDSAHSLAMGLHRRYLGMYRTALGRSQ